MNKSQSFTASCRFFPTITYARNTNTAHASTSLQHSFSFIMSLTPSTGKRPFPRHPQDDVSIRPPITPKYPFDLHYIKALFLARRYRQCIQRCQALLASQTSQVSIDAFAWQEHSNNTQLDAAHIVFLTFYAALSHESLARLMHDFSASKLSAYGAAETLYERAIDAASSKQRPICTTWVDKSFRHPHTTDNQTFTFPRLQINTALESEDEKHGTAGTPTIGSSLVNPRPVPQALNGARPGGLGVVQGLVNKFSRTFFSRERSPRGPFKQSNRHSGNITDSHNLHRPSTPTPMSRSASRMQLVDPFYGRRTTIVGLENLPEGGPGHLSATPPPRSETSSPANDEGNDEQVGSTERFNHGPVSPIVPFPLFIEPFYTISPSQHYLAHLEALQAQLRTHLQQVRVLQAETSAAQTERARQKRAQSILSSLPVPVKIKLPPSKSFWSFKDPQAETEKRKARIEAGRARGWTRERFDPGRYQRLAEDALTEMKRSV